MIPQQKKNQTLGAKLKSFFDSRSFAWRWLAFSFLVSSTVLVGTQVYQPKSAETRNLDEARWRLMVNHIQDVIDHYEGDVGLYIKNLNTGQVYEHNADTPFISASLIKVPIMAATIQAVWEGKLTLNTRIKYQRKYRRGGSGRLKWAKTGNYYSVSQLVYSMITKSDNTATAMLIDQMGYEYLNECFEKFDLKVTRINPDGMRLVSNLDPKKDNFTTPKEMGQLLEKLYQHNLVNDGLSDLMMEIMKGANARSRLKTHLPEEWQLARKTGLLRKNCHDVGIVFTPHGDYVICVMTGRNATYRKAKDIIASVGRAAYGFMGHNT